MRRVDILRDLQRDGERAMARIAVPVRHQVVTLPQQLPKTPVGGSGDSKAENDVVLRVVDNPVARFERDMEVFTGVKDLGRRGEPDDLRGRGQERG